MSAGLSRPGKRAGCEGQVLACCKEPKPLGDSHSHLKCSNGVIILPVMAGMDWY